MTPLRPLTFCPFQPEELSYALGKKGMTRKKLAKSSGCIVEYVGYTVFMSGKQRRAPTPPQPYTQQPLHPSPQPPDPILRLRTPETLHPQTPHLDLPPVPHLSTPSRSRHG